MNRPRVHFLGALVVALAACSGAEPAHPAPSGAAPAEPAFVAAMVSPLTKETPLQVVTVFASEADEKLISPATELTALIAKPRGEGGFGKESLRTLVLDPAPASVKARRLLYVALGPRAELNLDRVEAAGATAMRETLRLGVEHMAFAPILRDQGVTSLSPDEVAAAFVEAALVEYEAERRAAPDKPAALKDVTYEAGAPFIDVVTRAVARGVEAAHAHGYGKESAPAR